MAQYLFLINMQDIFNSNITIDDRVSSPLYSKDFDNAMGELDGVPQ